MFIILALAGSLISSTQGQFYDMDDDDFAVYVQNHGNVATEYGESAAKGCVAGGIGGATGGFIGLCVGCGLGAAGNVAQDVLFNEKADKALER